MLRTWAKYIERRPTATGRLRRWSTIEKWWGSECFGIDEQAVCNPATAPRATRTAGRASLGRANAGGATFLEAGVFPTRAHVHGPRERYDARPPLGQLRSIEGDWWWMESDRCCPGCIRTLGIFWGLGHEANGASAIRMPTIAGLRIMQATTPKRCFQCPYPLLEPEGAVDESEMG